MEATQFETSISSKINSVYNIYSLSWKEKTSLTTLGIEVSLRNIFKNKANRKDLLEYNISLLQQLKDQKSPSIY